MAEVGCNNPISFDFLNKSHFCINEPSLQSVAKCSQQNRAQFEQCDRWNMKTRRPMHPMFPVGARCRSPIRCYLDSCCKGLKFTSRSTKSLLHCGAPARQAACRERCLVVASHSLQDCHSLQMRCSPQDYKSHFNKLI